MPGHQVGPNFGVSVRIQPGELVVIAGGSGAGKTTLLQTLAGLSPPSSGWVRFDGIDAHEEPERFRAVLGYVPEDDMVHDQLPLERTLRFSAALRLAGASPSQVDTAVADSMAELGLAEHASTPVARLSGGQRKRASLATELLTRPRVFFLDEPTSGLDPATAADLMASLGRLAAEGSTVVLTSHAVQDLSMADRVLFPAPGGVLAFSGTPTEAMVHFDVDRLEGVYQLVGSEPHGSTWASRWAGRTASDDRGVEPRSLAAPPAAPPRPPGPWRQWLVLTRRTAATLVHDRLTMAILLGSPALVVAMFAVLFQPGAFDPAGPSPVAVIMIVFWIAFGVFFFGLTYGLLQICTELPIVRRERLVGLRVGSYVLAKLTVLLPFLVLVDVLASAAVRSPAQATLVLPMLCFPAVLFSGAIVPVPVMAWVGRALSVLMPDRWAFEAVGVDLRVRSLFADGGSPLGPSLLEAYGDSGSWTLPTYWLLLAGFAVVFLGATCAVLARRTATLAS